MAEFLEQNMEVVDDYEFAIGDTFLCYHGPLLYEAKCLDRKTTSDDKIEYYIHYKGWNSRWEEWVDTTRILPINDENMIKVESLKQIHSSKKKRDCTSIKVKKTEQLDISSESIQCVNVSLSNTPKPNKKRDRVPITVSTDQLSLDGVNSINKAVEEVDERTEIVKVTKSVVATKTIENGITDSIALKSRALYIPTVLKRKIAFDLVMITKYNKMVTFQKSNTVAKLINGYLSSKSTFCQQSQSIGLTLILHFNARIHTNLLYTEEIDKNIKKEADECLRERFDKCKLGKINYLEEFQPKKFYHRLYAPIYLLRLLVNLMEYIDQEQDERKYPDDQFVFIYSCFEDFVKYVEDNHEQYFPEDYYY